MSEQILSGVIAAIVSLLVAWLTARSAREKLKREFALEYATESAVRALLKQNKWKLRTFAAIERRLGGFESDELRKLLVRSGAVRAFRKEDNAELWGLVSRNPELFTSSVD